MSDRVAAADFSRALVVGSDRYDPTDWYWELDGTIWSSARAAIVTDTDPDYRKWLVVVIGRRPPRMTWPSLYEIMARYKPAAAAQLAADHVDDLDPARAAEILLASGCQVKSSSNSALNGTYDVSLATQQRMAAVTAGLPSGLTTLSWPDASGSLHSFTREEFLNLSSALGEHVYNILMTETLRAAGTRASWPSQPVTVP